MTKSKKNLLLNLAVVITLTFIFTSNCLVLNANAKAQNKTISYTVKKGDTLYLLGLRFNVSDSDISSANPEIDPSNLNIGSKIKVPIGTGIMIHHIKKGESLWKIATKHNTTIKMIADKNYIKNPNLIYAGDVLAIPDAMHHDVSVLQKQVIGMLRDRDFKALSKCAHPEKGVRFSPYSYVAEQDKVFTPSQIANFDTDNTKYLWGYFDGSGFDIEFTPSQYFDRFVYNKDFVNLGTVNYNQMKGVGNTLENQFEVYPGSSIVEYYFKGSDQYSGMDWASLRMVFEKHGGRWYLVGIIHNEWTI